MTLKASYNFYSKCINLFIAIKIFNKYIYYS